MCVQFLFRISFFMIFYLILSFCPICNTHTRMYRHSHIDSVMFSIRACLAQCMLCVTFVFRLEVVASVACRNPSAYSMRLCVRRKKETKKNNKIIIYVRTSMFNLSHWNASSKCMHIRYTQLIHHILSAHVSVCVCWWRMHGTWHCSMNTRYIATLLL